MVFADFRERFQRFLPVGTILNNPRKGSSEIISYRADTVTYRRGVSTIRASLVVFFNVYVKYSGVSVSSNDLRSYLPAVFDSKARPAGHSCNCTFLFVSFQRMGLAGELSGKGVSGAPFSVVLVAE